MARRAAWRYPPAVPLQVQVLVSPGCPHGEEAAALVGSVLQARAPDAALEVLVVASDAAAARLAFPGSPTVRVDGRDVDPAGPPPVGGG